MQEINAKKGARTRAPGASPLRPCQGPLAPTRACALLEVARSRIHDGDTKFSAAFDTMFPVEEVSIIRTPVQAPNANAFAERWTRSVREECLDRILILNECHLHRVLTSYVDYYNHARPHQGIHQRCPVPLDSAAKDGPIKRRDVVGSVLHDDERHAA